MNETTTTQNNNKLYNWIVYGNGGELLIISVAILMGVIGYMSWWLTAGIVATGCLMYFNVGRSKKP